MLKKRLKTVVAVSLIFGLVVLSGCGESVKGEKGDYTVRISNWTGGNRYLCDRFEVVNDTYFLYDREGVLIATLTAPDGSGYAIESWGN